MSSTDGTEIPDIMLKHVPAGDGSKDVRRYLYEQLDKLAINENWGEILYCKVKEVPESKKASTRTRLAWVRFVNPNVHAAVIRHIDGNYFCFNNHETYLAAQFNDRRTHKEEVVKFMKVCKVNNVS